MSATGTADDWERREALLDRLLELPADEQQRFLDELERGDAADAQALRGWLAGIEQSDGRWVADDAQPALGHAGERVGPWRVLRLLGRGGMGEVWLGERADGLFTRHVAIKFIRHDHPALRKGIESERRLLAGLRHPGIVRLLDAGTTAEGHPYLVTEYIDGIRLDAWLQQHAPDLAACLDLFVQVAQATAHAHEQLVIHRDIKPANILVDAEGHAHLLDFGIARAIADSADAEAAAQPTQAVMTPEFAAPEFVTGGVVGVRSDVHALGGLLYYLLCGQPPLDLQGLSLAAMVERIRDQSPQPLLARIPTALRQDASARWLRDLEAIALKALAKDPADRYGTVEALLRDIDAARLQLPLSARPLGRMERARRTLWRHRVAVAIVAALIGTLLAGLGGTIWQGRQAARQRDIAELEARNALAARDFMVGVFEAANPEHTQGQAPTAVQLLDAGVRRIERDLQGRPALQADLFAALGDSYTGLGEFARAVELQHRAYDLAVSAWGEDAQASRRILGRYAFAVLQQGGPYDGVRQALERSLAHPVPGDAAARAMSAELRASLGGVLHRTGHLEQAQRLLDQSMAEARALGEAGRPALVTALFQRSTLADAQGRREQAITGFRELVALLDALPAASVSNRQAAMQNLATLLGQTGRGDEAQAILLRLRDANAAMYGEHHPATIYANVQLGRALLRRSSNKEARELLERMVALAAGRVGEDSEVAAFARVNLAAVELAEDRHATAIALLEQVRRQVVAQEGGHSPRALMMLQNLARVRIDAGELAQAGLDLDVLLAGLQAIESDATAEPLALMGTIARLQGQPARASELHRRALETTRAAGEGDSLDAQDYRLLLAEDARDLQDYQAAREHARQALDGLSKLEDSSTVKLGVATRYLLAQLDVLQQRCPAQARDAMDAYRRQLVAPFAAGQPPPVTRARVDAVDLHLALCALHASPRDPGEPARVAEAARRVLQSGSGDPYVMRLARRFQQEPGSQDR